MEPEANLQGSCDRILASFWKEVGNQDFHDYEDGFELKPSLYVSIASRRSSLSDQLCSYSAWINKQREYYAKELKANNDKQRKTEVSDTRDKPKDKNDTSESVSY